MLKNGYLPLLVNNKSRKLYIELLSRYNLHTPELDSKSESLIEENEHFEALYRFFSAEYQNSQHLLDEIRG
jgi:adenosine deaminase